MGRNAGRLLQKREVEVPEPAGVSTQLGSGLLQRREVSPSLQEPASQLIGGSKMAASFAPRLPRARKWQLYGGTSLNGEYGSHWNALN